MEFVCTNIDNNQFLGSISRSARDRGREPANHNEAAAFGPSPGKFAKTDVVLPLYRSDTVLLVIPVYWMSVRIPIPATVFRRTTFFCVLSKLMMAPKRLSSDENKESGESASVSEPQPSSSGFTGITPGEKLPNEHAL
ncbi:hypothetical protein E2C01_083776 [Portunus trituberculatus]|uniref:Uncharacterized protein n=1 Tax=Portunus trituberculatus TaxID=210409 RepID=A0A5B7J8X2_PORTR|nr:hypothetical protein [Portunus trituberculatus]